MGIGLPPPLLGHLVLTRGGVKIFGRRLMCYDTIAPSVLRALRVNSGYVIITGHYVIITDMTFMWSNDCTSALQTRANARLKHVSKGLYKLQEQDI